MLTDTSLQTKDDAVDLAYYIVGNGYCKLVLPTKKRNEIIAYVSGMNGLMWQGEVYNIVSKNLGGGIWELTRERVVYAGA